MTTYNVEIRVNRLVPRGQLHPDDRSSGPIGEYWWTVQADSPEEAEELALDWFHDHHAIAVLDDHEITTTPWLGAKEPLPDFKRIADRIDGYDRDDLGLSPDY